MGAWSHEIFGSDDAGDMSDFIGNFVGTKSIEDEYGLMEYSVCSPERWDRKMVKFMKAGFEANMDGFLEFIAAEYKIRRKRFKDLTDACSFSDEGTFGLVLTALIMNAGANMPDIVRLIGFNAIANELADTERLGEWNDNGVGRIRALKAFARKLEAYKGGRRVKIL